MTVGFRIELVGSRGELQIDDPPRLGNESHHLVCHAEQAGCHCVLFGRLYHTKPLEELRRCGGINAANPVEVANDASLVLSLYTRERATGLEQLAGEYSLAIWDARRQLLIGSRDPLGAYPLYWSLRSPRLAMSTSLREMAQRLGLGELNPEYLAEYLTPGGLRQEGATAQCVFQGAERILPGQTVVIDAGSATVTRHSWWDWHSKIILPASTRMDDAASQLREVLEESIRERLRGTTVMHVSGGIDSTGVACLAHQVLRGGSRRASLIGEALVYHRLPKLSQEGPFLDLAGLALADLPLRRIAGDEILNFDSFAAPPPHDEPYQGLWQIEAEAALMAGAESLRANTVFTGIGGDEVHDNTPFELADLCRRGQFRSAWRLASETAQHWHEFPWNVLLSFGIRPGWQRCRATRGLWSRRSGGPGNSLRAWIRPEFARRWDLVGRAWDSLKKQYGQSDSVHLSIALSGIQDRAGSVARQALGAAAGIHLTHPLLDPRVVCLGLGIRSRVALPLGPQKPLLARAFAGLVPDAILTRGRKGHFDELYYLGLARHHRELRELITQSASKTADWLDHDRLLRQLDTAALGGLTADRLRSFDSALCLLCWMKHYGTWSGISPPTAVHDL